MKFFVACPEWLFLVDAQSREVGVVESGRGEYYGVSWPTDGTELCVTHSGVNNDSLVTLEDYAESEQGYLTVGGRRGPDCLSQPHQIVCTADHVLIANTGRNCLTIARREDLFYRHVWPNKARWDRKGRDACIGNHFNSVALVGNRVLFLAHNFRRGSEIVELTWPQLEVVRTIPTKLAGAHNLWPLPTGEILTCDTERGALVDAATGRVYWQNGVANQFTRGVASDGQHVFVGMSHAGARTDRRYSDGGVWILDRATWVQVDFIPLPFAGNVNEVRLADVSDECHHGRPLRQLPEPSDRLTEAYHRFARRIRVANGPAPQPTARLGLPWTAIHGIIVAEGSALVCVMDDVLSLAAYDGLVAQDVVVSAQVSPAAGDGRHAGLFARYRGPSDSKMLCALLSRSALGPAASIWQHDGNEWALLAEALVGRAEGLLTFTVRGPLANVALDGELVLTAADCVLAAGFVGVRGLGGSFADFHAAAPPVEADEDATCRAP